MSASTLDCHGTRLVHFYQPNST